MNENTPPEVADKATQTPQINPEELVAKSTEAVREKLEADFQKRLEEAEARAVERASQEMVKRIAGEKEEEEYHPKSWDQVRDDAAAEAEKRMEAKLQAEKEAEEKRRLESEKSREENQKKMNEYWDKQLKDLTEAGYIPELPDEISKKLAAGQKLTEDELRDPGVQARQEIFKTASENKESNLELVFYKHINGKRQNSGAFAPVGGAHKNVTTQQKSGFSYEDIHNSSIEDLVKEAFPGQ